MQYRESAGRLRLFGVDDPTHKGDPDGLIAAAGLGGLRDEVELVGFVANRAPAAKRAAMARFALDRSGCDAPVGVGAEIGSARDDELVTSPFEAHPGSMRGEDLCEKVLAGCAPRSVRAFFTSPFREAAWLIDRPDLWCAFERVAVMGGVTRTGSGWEPDTAFNNRADEDAARHFYRRVLELGTPVTLVDRGLALWAKVPKETWLAARESSDPWVVEMGSAMLRQWERMWDGVTSGVLPADRTPEWYLDNWCDGARPDWYHAWRNGERPEMPKAITPFVNGAPAYDVLTVATLLTDEPLGKVETHPSHPNFHVLRPDPTDGPGKAVAAQLRLIRAAFRSA